MKPDPREMLGMALLVVCAVSGFVSTYLLAGLGICGLELTKRMFWFALSAAAILPSVTGRFLRGPWWLSPAVFCSLLPIIMFFELLDREWTRFFAQSGCVLTAVAGAWLFKLRSSKVNKHTSRMLL
jgi:hypothetical protein